MRKWSDLVEETYLMLCWEERIEMKNIKQRKKTIWQSNYLIKV